MIKKRNFFKNKKADTIVFETVIFILLNLIFFVVMLVFARSSGSLASVYEETYAKQIALLIDNAKPEMSILVPMDNLIKIAEKEGKSAEEIVILDGEENIVIVSLKKKGGFKYQYFSGHKIELELKNKYLHINILKNE